MTDNPAALAFESLPKGQMVCCTFCGRSRDEVKSLAAAPEMKAFICGECADLAHIICSNVSLTNVYHTDRFRATPDKLGGYTIASPDDSEFFYARVIPPAFAWMAIDLAEAAFTYGARVTAERVQGQIPDLIGDLSRPANPRTISPGDWDT